MWHKLSDIRIAIQGWGLWSPWVGYNSSFGHQMAPSSNGCWKWNVVICPCVAKAFKLCFDLPINGVAVLKWLTFWNESSLKTFPFDSLFSLYLTNDFIWNSEIEKWVPQKNRPPMRVTHFTRIAQNGGKGFAGKNMPQTLQWLQFTLSAGRLCPSKSEFNIF